MMKADPLGRREPQHRAELGQHELPIQHAIGTECGQYPPGGCGVLLHRIGGGRPGLPAGQVPAVSGRRGGPAVMLRRHVRDQL